MCRFVHLAVAAALALTVSATASAAESIHVYGSGGPTPAMKEAPAAFGTVHGITVDVTAVPTPTWIEGADTDADVIFSGSEPMMTDFIDALGDEVELSTVRPLYFRAAAILVRPGNPGRVTGIKDLRKPGHRVLVVNGVAQNGLWQDMVGHTGDTGVVLTKKGVQSANAKAFATYLESPKVARVFAK